MKLELGMHVRSKYGIDKITKVNTGCSIDGKEVVYIERKEDSLWGFMLKIEDISKASYNIIDLIEEGDYVNGVEVEDINEKEIMLADTHLWIDKEVANRLIESIVTHEQFESMKYEVE